MFDFDMNTMNSAERYGEASKAIEEQRRKSEKEIMLFYKPQRKVRNGTYYY